MKSGGHVLDGCGEFMPSGEDGTADGFKCAACECHRSFHRRVVEVVDNGRIKVVSYGMFNYYYYYYYYYILRSNNEKENYVLFNYNTR